MSSTLSDLLHRGGEREGNTEQHDTHTPTDQGCCLQVTLHFNASASAADDQQSLHKASYDIMVRLWL